MVKLSMLLVTKQVESRPIMSVLSRQAESSLEVLSGQVESLVVLSRQVESLLVRSRVLESLVVMSTQVESQGVLSRLEGS